jgi:hypothetical protein
MEVLYKIKSNIIGDIDTIDDKISSVIADTINKMMLFGNDKTIYPITSQFFEMQENNNIDINFIKYHLDKLLLNKDEEALQIPLFKVNLNDFNLEKLKFYSNNLTKPCVFEFDVDIYELNGIEGKILNSELKSIYDKETNSFYNSTKFNDKRQNIFNQVIDKPELLNFFPNLNEYLFNGNGFISKKGDFTPSHNEPEITLNIQIKGEKNWIIVPPENSDYLLPIKSINAINYYSIFSTDKELFNKFRKKIPRYETILKRNQCLFIPAWAFHTVSTLEDSSSLSLRYIIPEYMFNELYLPKNIFNHIILNNISNISNITSFLSNLKNLPFFLPLLDFIEYKIFPKLVDVGLNIKKSSHLPAYLMIKDYIDSYLKNN